MKDYVRIRVKTGRASRLVGAGVAVLAHTAVLGLASFSGMKYIYPPPEETTFVVDFTEQEEVRVKPLKGRSPRSRTPDRTKKVELVRRSESPYESDRRNLTPKGTTDDHGDVETPSPKTGELDRRAMFPGMSKKDTTLTAPHSAEKASTKFTEGEPDGNTTRTATGERPNAHLKGRSVTNATIPSPVYNIQESGTVVVRIFVDSYGKVIKAIPGAGGTTVSNSTLWNEARKAAMKTTFNPSTEAGAVQEGTITYIFKLR